MSFSVASLSKIYKYPLQMKSLLTSPVTVYQTINAYSGQRQSGDSNTISQKKKIIGKIFEGEMLIRKLPTTLLQIFLKNIFNSKITRNCISDPDDNFWRNS